MNPWYVWCCETCGIYFRVRSLLHNGWNAARIKRHQPLGLQVIWHQQVFHIWPIFCIPISSAGERAKDKKASKYGSEKIRLGKDAMKNFIPSKLTSSRWKLPWINNSIKRKINKKKRCLSISSLDKESWGPPRLNNRLVFRKKWCWNSVS